MKDLNDKEEPASTAFRMLMREPISTRRKIDAPLPHRKSDRKLKELPIVSLSSNENEEPSFEMPYNESEPGIKRNGY